jgi:hypothetical protein
MKRSLTIALSTSFRWRRRMPLQHVQRVLRHSTPTVTANTYGHMVVEDLRDALNIMRAGPVAIPTRKRKAPTEGQ